MQSTYNDIGENPLHLLEPVDSSNLESEQTYDTFIHHRTASSCYQCSVASFPGSYREGVVLETLPLQEPGHKAKCSDTMLCGEPCPVAVKRKSL